MNSFHSRNSRPAPAKARKEEAPPPRKGVRADVLLVEQGLAASRALARDLILQGWVLGPAGPITKPSQELPPHTRLQLLDERQMP
ncbi:MAG TPA: hypothetical protein VFK74_00900 [Azospira sp.]|nr:hypothetical protein [Azospira sp.]